MCKFINKYFLIFIIIKYAPVFSQTELFCMRYYTQQATLLAWKRIICDRCSNTKSYLLLSSYAAAYLSLLNYRYGPPRRHQPNRLRRVRPWLGSEPRGHSLPRKRGCRPRVTRRLIRQTGRGGHFRMCHSNHLENVGH
jgi:hypothetical protein